MKKKSINLRNILRSYAYAVIVLWLCCVVSIYKSSFSSHFLFILKQVPSLKTPTGPV